MTTKTITPQNPAAKAQKYAAARDVERKNLGRLHPRKTMSARRP